MGKARGSLLRRFLRDEAGGPAIEWALTLPLLVAILLGGVEVGRLIVLDQKMDRVAGTIADLVAQADNLTPGEVDMLLGAAKHIAQPFDLAANGTVIASSVTATGLGVPVVNWQRQQGTAVSDVGAANGAASLPQGFSLLAPNDTVIVAEAFYDFKPMFYGAIVPARTLRHQAFFRPRLGSLKKLN